MTAKEVAEAMGIVEGTAYKVIRQLNAQLKDQGYITIAGKVSRRYFSERYYGYGGGMDGRQQQEQC